MFPVPIQDVYKRQVTILARFQNMDDYVGEDIHYFDKYNPLVRKENKLMQSAIEAVSYTHLC